LRDKSIAFFKERHCSSLGFVAAAMDKYGVTKVIADAMLMHGRNAYYYRRAKKTTTLAPKKPRKSRAKVKNQEKFAQDVGWTSAYDDVVLIYYTEDGASSPPGTHTILVL
jgi:hypothetical protein